MDIPFGLASYRRDAAQLPEFRLINMLAEATPTAKSQVAIIGRPGVNSVATWGSGPINGVFREEGVFNGDRFALSGQTLYREGASIGTVLGDGACKFAASPLELVVCRGGKAYSYNGTDFAQIVLPDDFECITVAFIATLFLFGRGDDFPNRWYWSAILDARSIDALDFASAESAADSLLEIIIVGDNVYLLGGATIEIWMLTGTAALPFSRQSQRLFRKGVIQTGAAAQHDNTLFFVGNDCRVYRLAEVPQRISDSGIEEQIRKSATCRVFTYGYDGHDLFAVRLDAQTWLYDAATGQPSEFQTLTRANWKANCAAMVGGEPLFGDDTTGDLLQFSGYADGTADLERIVCAAMPVSGSAIIDNVGIEVNSGGAAFLSGEGDDPIVEMRVSRDGGRTFGAWRGVSLGQQGEFRRRAVWRRCGSVDAPGVLFEFRLSDPSPFRVSRAFVNEPTGGRGR